MVFNASLTLSGSIWGWKIAENNCGKLKQRQVYRNDTGQLRVIGEPSSEDDSKQKMLRNQKESLAQATGLGWSGWWWAAPASARSHRGHHDQILMVPACFTHPLKIQKPRQEHPKTEPKSQAGCGERTVRPPSVLWWEAGPCCIKSYGKASNCWGAKNAIFTNIWNN